MRRFRVFRVPFFRVFRGKTASAAMLQVTKPTKARITALQIMRSVRQGELADRAFVRMLADVPARERAWLHELIYGTLRLQGRLDFILDQYVKRGVAKLDPDVHDILRLGAYQLLEMHSVPAYAAVSQAVELTKSSNVKSASGLVNGVLQSIRRNQKNLPHDESRWTSHPEWMLERWKARFGWQETLALTEANNTRPQLYVRPVGNSKSAAVQQLDGAEPVPGAPDALRITGDASVTEVLDATPSIVQDPAAGLVVRYAGFQEGIVADLCAAPGGKAIAIADGLTRGSVVATDISESRMQRLVENKNRLQLKDLLVAVADARKPVIAQADAVLIDAPCTGTGTFRRHPDGKWRIHPADLADLVDLQRDLLDAAAGIVRPGGLLVYSTCSIEPEENEMQVQTFLARYNGAFRLVPPSSWHDRSQLNDEGMLVMLPHRHGFDGAFAARMERVA
jgi:16S rRNA (cytosine967-C5)-methyltransferase